MPVLDLRDALGRAIAGAKVTGVARGIATFNDSSLALRGAMLGGDGEFTDAGAGAERGGH